MLAVAVVFLLVSGTSFALDFPTDVRSATDRMHSVRSEVAMERFQAGAGRSFSPDMSIGLDMMLIGLSTRKADGGGIDLVRGISSGIGYAQKHYFDPVETGTFNPHWHWGTVALLFPYIGIGADYVTDEGFYVTIGTFYIAPYIGIGVYF